jgi:hypothetical protein
MRIGRMRTSLLATLAAIGCDPAPGSEIACDPGDAPTDAVSDEVAPDDPAALQAWLVADAYAGYLAESGVHGSATHTSVRTYVNRRLAESLATCASPHPVGATAVKELYDGDDLRGWAVMVKTQPAHGAGAWYWYEVFDVTAGGEPAVAGQGDGTCTGCHDAGLDAFRSRWPLQ